MGDLSVGTLMQLSAWGLGIGTFFFAFTGIRFDKDFYLTMGLVACTLGDLAFAAFLSENNDEDFGLEEFPAEAVLGGSPADNVARWRKLIKGNNDDKALEAFVSATAGAALWIAGVGESLVGSVEMARSALRSGVVGQFVDCVFEVETRSRD